MTTRRNILGWLGALAVLGPARALAQSGARYVVGTLMAGAPEADRQLITYLKQGMESLGYVEGRNVEYVHRWANGAFDKLPGLAQEIAAARAGVVVVVGASVASAVQKAVPALPVVLAGGFDPVGAGVAETRGNPGRSVTGIVNLSYELTEKQLRLVREVLPGARRVGVLHSMTAGNQRVLARLQRRAHELGFDLTDAGAGAAAAIPAAFEHLRNAKVEALVVFSSPLFDAARPVVLDQAAQLGVLAVYPDSGYVDAGGMLSYGPTRSEIFFSAATYVNRILKGAKPGSLAMTHPTQFELVANKRTAALLGVKLPPSVLERADDVIE